MDTIESLQQQHAEIRDKLSRLESVKRFEEHQKLLGKCFRYRNCYSCPKTEDDYWWLYRRVIGFTKDGYLQVFQFQRDQYDKIEIETCTRQTSCGGEPITLKQFQYAFKIVARMVNDRARSAKALP